MTTQHAPDLIDILRGQYTRNNDGGGLHGTCRVDNNALLELCRMTEELIKQHAELLRVADQCECSRCVGTGVVQTLSPDVPSGFMTCSDCSGTGYIDVTALRASHAELLAIIADCDDYLNTNKYTNIGHGSILHRKMQEAIAKAGGGV